MVCTMLCDAILFRPVRTPRAERATIERVHWSPVGWQPEEVHRVSHMEEPPVDERDVISAAEMRTASDPPQGVTVMLVVLHGWPYDLVRSARVR
jgi:hypothetical protein